MKSFSGFNESTDRVMKESSAVRKTMSKRPVAFLGVLPTGIERDYAKNFSSMINNRCMDIFDDAKLLITNQRLSSACVIARGMIETYAFGKGALEAVAATLAAKGSSAAEASMIKIINSSFYKVKEQKSFKAGKFDLKDYHFTEEAKRRIANSEADIVKISEQLQNMFKDEMKVTGRKESRLEMTYDALCEWTHPSQTSLFHAYCPDTHAVPTSLGNVNFWDAARNHCVNGLHFITAVPALCRDLDRLGDATLGKPTTPA